MLQPQFNITTEITDGNYSRIVIDPLEKGYGQTLGVALRRVLLTSIEGAAVTEVAIQGAQHQFTTIEGLQEDMVELVLNIKQLHFSIEDKDVDEVKATLSASKTGAVTAADINLPVGVTLANPDQELGTLTGKSASLDIELTIKRGVGYEMAAEAGTAFGTIPVDASYSPIVKVAYKVEATRVGRRTDFDKLILDIWTTGSVAAEDAVKDAARILVAHFNQVIDPVVIEIPKEESLVDKVEDEVFRLTVEELDLPTRIANALRKGGFATVKELVTATREDFGKVKNLGDKSIDTVVEALEKKGVTVSL